MLLGKGARVDMKNKEGHSALMFACKMGELEIAKILYQRNNDEINQVSKIGKSCLTLAVSESRLNICKWLLQDLNQDVNSRALFNSEFALKEAASLGKTEYCDYLHQHGADVNLRDNDGFTSIMIACKNGHLDTAKKLHELGARTDLESNDELNCLMLAAR